MPQSIVHEDLVGYPDGYLYGLETSRTTGTNIGISDGKCRDSSNSKNMILNHGSFNKLINSTWAEGDNTGGRGTASLSDGWYHLFLILKNDGVTVDAGFDTSETATNLLGSYATNYSWYRRIWSVWVVSSSIVSYKQNKNIGTWDDPPQTISVADQGGSNVDRVMTVPAISGIIAHLNFLFWKSGANPYLYIRDLNQNDEAPLNVAPGATWRNSSSGQAQGTKISIPVNSLGKIGTRASESSCNLEIYTLGWTDSLGRGYY